MAQALALKKLLLSTIALGAVHAGSAAAQTPPVEPGGEELDEVIVTGSRIQRREFTSTSPVQVITAETSQDAGLLTAADVLQSSQAALGSNQTGLATSSPASLGGPATSTVSLRGLGPQRTLVLMNGRRVNPAGARGQVVSADLNTIPNSAVQRVEILKDGASSIYGSDAVAGVVNIITRSDLNGVVVEASENRTFDGGGDIASWSASVGRQLENGHWLASFQYTDQKALLASERDWSACPQALSTRATTDPGRTTFTDTGVSNDPPGVCTVAPFGVVTFGGRATSQLVGMDFDGTPLYDPNSLRLRAERGAVLNQQVFGPGAALFGFVPGAPIYPTATPIANFAVVAPAALGRTARNGSTPFELPRYGETTMISPTSTSNFFLSGGMDLVSLGGAELFYEAQYSNRESSQFGVGQVAITGVNNASNPFGRPVQVIFPGFYDSDQTVDAYRLLGGLRGEFDFGWDWELYYQFGNSDARYGADVFLADRMTAALALTATTDPTMPAIQVGSTRYTCTANTVTRLGPLCRPLNVFTPELLLDGLPTASTLTVGGQNVLDVLDYIMGYDQGTTNYRTETVAGSMAGRLFTLPAGDVEAAAGFEWRRESINDQPGAQSQAGNVYQGTQAGPTIGSDSVREIFAEAEAPLLRDLALVKDLTLNLSARWTDYESSGDNVTYKAAVRWDVNDVFGLRATYGTSYRAPALFEQFLGNQFGSLTVSSQDPCSPANRATSPVRDANCAADGVPVTFSTPLQSYTTIIIGNGQSLEPETSTNFTAGLVLLRALPEAWGDLSLAIDYTEITIEDQVASYSPLNVASFCYSDPLFRANTAGFCQYVSPRSAGPIYTLTVQSPFFNLNEEVYRGVDLSARWSREFGFGQLSIDANASKTLENVVDLFGGLRQDKNDTLGEPELTGQIQTRLDTGRWSFMLLSQYVGAANFSNEAFSTGNNCSFFVPATRADGVQVNVDPECFTLDTDPIWFHTGSVRFEADDWTLRLGVQNLFDEQPPLISASAGVFPRYGNAAYSSQYQQAYRGRSAFVTLTARF